MQKFLFVLLCTGLLFACNAGTESADDTMAEETMEEEAPTSALKMSPMSPSVDFPDAAITGIIYEDGAFAYQISDYELGMQTPDADAKMCANSAKGQHIHLIPNNEPYIAKYEANFEQALPDGDHIIMTFLSRSYHESLKHATAGKAMKVTVADGSFTSTETVTEPMLFYSRPKGTYTGEKETKRVMLDFYPVNAKIGTDHMVKASINGEEMTLDKWQPYILEGLPMGENTITLTLVDQAGNTVDTPLNPVTRTFTLQEMPLEN